MTRNIVLFGVLLFAGCCSEVLDRQAVIRENFRKEFAEKLAANISSRAIDWAHEPGNSTILAFASLGQKIKDGGYPFLKELKNGESRIVSN